MTISSETSKVIYTGNDVASVFAYTFKIFKNTDIEVTEIIIATGAETLLVLTTDYTVSGVGDDAGGNVTLVAGALPSTKELVIRRDPKLLQETDYEEYDKFPAETHEKALDKQVIISQSLKEVLDRIVQRPITESTPLILPALVAGKVLSNDGVNLLWSTITATDYNGSMIAGLDASKAAVPAVNDIYIATDTKRFYVCFVAGTWSVINHHYGLDANKAATPIVGEIYSATDTEIVYICVVAGVWTKFAGSTKKTGQQNLLLNGNFEYWYAGISSAPDEWTLAGGGSVAREGATKLIDTYSMKLTSDADGNTVSQSVHSRERGIAYWKSRYATLAVWVYAADAANARIGIYDGVGTTYSSYHTGGSSWELLTVTRKVDAAATELTARLVCDGNVKIGYFDGTMFSEGSAPYAFISHPVIDTNHPAIAPNEDMKNLVVVLNSGTPASQVDIDADVLQVEGYNLASINRTIDATGTGADGLDAGALANDTWYSVWVIYNPTLNLVAGLISTSETAPTMPTGYTKKRKIGHVRTGGAASFNDNGSVAESFGDKFHDRGDPSSVDFTVGDLTTDDTWRDLDLSNIVPDGAKFIALHNETEDGTINIHFSVRKNGNSNAINVSRNYIQVSGIVLGNDLVVACDSSRIIEYLTFATTWSIINITVTGWWR